MSTATGDKIAVHTGQQVRPINVITGVPDDRLCSIKVEKNSAEMSILLPGTPGILNFLPQRLFKPTIINLDPGAHDISVQLGAGPLLNHIADADRCAKVLAKAEKMVGQLGRACFNHPSAVLETGRDAVARKLAGIAGLQAPKTMRVIAREPVDLHKDIEAAEISYPVLVRIAGDHGGVSTAKIDTPDDLPEIRKLNCYDKAVYVTAFADFVSPDGRYRKFRVAVVGGEILLRHMLIGDSWMLHAGRRGANTEAEEARMMATFDAELGPRVRPIFEEMTRRLDLDYYGVDCNITPDGQVTLFEANACMNILPNTSSSPNMWDEPILKIKRALFGLLAQPRRWRHPPRPVAQA